MKEMQMRRQHPSCCTKKRALSLKHIQHGCVLCLVCVKGDQAQKHPHWVFLSSKKSATLVYFCAQYVLSMKPPMLGGLCARQAQTHTPIWCFHAWRMWACQFGLKMAGL